MKNRKATINELVTVLFWSIVIGMVGISIGPGALYPPPNYIPKPFVCPNGQMTFEKQTTQTAPNKTIYYADWSCRNGETTSSINPFPYSGVTYG